MLAALIVPGNAHANTTGCIANPVDTSCNYISDGGTIEYSGITLSGSIDIYRVFASAPTNCPTWTVTKKSCRVAHNVFPYVIGGSGSAMRSGTMTTFDNVATGMVGDTIKPGDQITASSAGIIGIGLPNFSGILKVVDAA